MRRAGKPIVFCALAALVVAPTTARTTVNSRLASTVAKVTGMRLTVGCESSWRAWSNDPAGGPTRLAYARFVGRADGSWKPVSIKLGPYACVPLGDALSGKKVRVQSLGSAIGVLSHEEVHVVHPVWGENKVTCRELDLVVPTTRSLGFGAMLARIMAQARLDHRGALAEFLVKC